jgi:hypothetical protein
LKTKHDISYSNNEKLTWNNFGNLEPEIIDLKGWNTENLNENTNLKNNGKTKSFILKENIKCPLCEKSM